MVSTCIEAIEAVQILVASNLSLIPPSSDSLKSLANAYTSSLGHFRRCRPGRSVPSTFRHVAIYCSTLGLIGSLVSYIMYVRVHARFARAFHGNLRSSWTLWPYLLDIFLIDVEIHGVSLMTWRIGTVGLATI